MDHLKFKYFTFDYLKILIYPIPNFAKGTISEVINQDVDIAA